ncbi:hypothetical protein [Paraburkholderia sp. J12]|nr:hypothetical protein [Paraburkholderia sp. J12]
MQFGLLLSNLPQVEVSRSHYTAFLSLEPCPAAIRLRAFWQRLKALAS